MQFGQRDLEGNTKGSSVKNVPELKSLSIIPYIILEYCKVQFLSYM